MDCSHYLLVTNNLTPVTCKSNCLQIVHCRSNDWITVSTIGCTLMSNTVFLYVSLYSSTDNVTVTMNVLHLLLGEDVCVRMEACPKKVWLTTVVYAIAVYVGLTSSGHLPQNFTKERMRSHMLECLNSKYFPFFPCRE